MPGNPLHANPRDGARDKGRKNHDDDDDDDGERFVYSYINKSASASAALHRDRQGLNLPPPPKWAASWKAAGCGVKAAEMGLTGPSLSGDCVAVDESDPDCVVGVGGDGEGSTLSVYSISRGQAVDNLKGHADLHFVCFFRPMGHHELL